MKKGKVTIKVNNGLIWAGLIIAMLSMALTAYVTYNRLEDEENTSSEVIETQVETEQTE